MTNVLPFSKALEQAFTAADEYREALAVLKTLHGRRPITRVNTRAVDEAYAKLSAAQQQLEQQNGW